MAQVRVLVVDDHEGWRSSIKDAIEFMNDEYEVVTAAEYKSAIQALDHSEENNRPFHIITLDHDLSDASPGNDRLGIKGSANVLRRLRKYKFPVAVLIVSGRAGAKEVRNYLRNAAQDYNLIDLNFIGKDEFDDEFEDAFEEILHKVMDRASFSERLPTAVAGKSTDRSILCFISYTRRNRRDVEFAIRLMNDLRALNVGVWRDEESIEKGQNWDREIQKALERCTHLLLVATPLSVTSDNVLNEISVAVDKGKMIIPILLETCEMPLRITRLQWIDFRSDYQNPLSELMATLGLPEDE